MMDSTRIKVLGVAAVSLAAMVFSAYAAEKAAVTVKTDRESALYKCGEQAEFDVTVMKDGKLLKNGEATAELSNDGLKKMGKQKIDLSKNNPFKISGAMEKPGFLRCTVVVGNPADKLSGLGGAGFEPEKIQPMTQMPEDFKKFWADGQKRLEQIPPDVKLEKLEKYCNDKHECYKISFANIDNTRIYGFLSVPKGKGPFPAFVTVLGAGPGACSPNTQFVDKGVLTLVMNVHPYDPPLERKQLEKLYKELNKELSYPLQGAPDMEKYFFRRAILGINRAVDWLAARSDWDKKHLVVSGSSQGGAFTLILAGLNPNVTAAGANVPALCDHAGYLAERSPGWPRLVLGYGKQKPEFLKMSAYFDTVNFARNITCPTVVCVGFIDTTCSASSVYAAYNIINAPKLIVNKTLMGHRQDPEFYAFLNKWITGQLGLEKPLPPTKK
ncbi:MAG: acetylxylan esterase [Victivallaceae bacterium]